jgi:hypothetical protein
MNVRAVCIAAVLCALCACGSASDAVTFQAPAGFKPEMSVGPFAQGWSGPQGQSLMLMALPAKIDLSKTVEESPVTNGTIEHDTMTTICGDQPARVLDLVGSIASSSGSKDRERRDIQTVATNAGGKTYFAIYARPIGMPANPAAEAAIRHVCARSKNS